MQSPIRNLLISVLVLGLFITSGLSIISIFKTESPQYFSDERIDKFNTSFNKLDAMSRTINETKDNIITSKPTEGVGGFLSGLVYLSWNSVKTIFTSFSFIFSLSDGLNTVFGIPPFVSNGILALLTIIVVFSIWAAIFQRDL